MLRPQSLALREDAAIKPLRERGRLLEATTTDTGAIRRKIQIITPGWGSSGYYSADVLERAATDKVIPAGTHMYLNHASESESRDRPERDVEKIAAVLVEDARWDGTRLLGEADIVGPHAELIESLAPYIGVSISGSATEITIGEAEGRTGPIIEGLAHVSSVDFVTHAGRGGMVLLESARPSLVNARAVGHGVAESTANETREQLQQALRDLLGGENSYVWVRDFEETDDGNTVWYEHETPDASGTYGLTYTITDDGAVTLSGSPTEVRATTTYIPVSAPASAAAGEARVPVIRNAADARKFVAEYGDAIRAARQFGPPVLGPNDVPVARPDSTTPTATHESKEDTVEITDEEYQLLQARAGRADELEAIEAERDRRDAARKVIGERAAEAKVEFTPLEERGLLADMPLTEAGELDTAAFTVAVDEAVKAVAERATQTTGRTGPVGFGASAADDTPVEESTPTTTPWGRPLTVKGA